MKQKRKVECPECEGKGYIAWGDKNDEIEECPVCEGHGSWLEEYDPNDDKYIIDDEYLETMKRDIEDNLIEQVRKERIIYWKPKSM